MSVHYTYMICPHTYSLLLWWKTLQEFDTTIQLNEESKAKWYRKLSRELYSLYRKIKMTNLIKNTDEKNIFAV